MKLLDLTLPDAAENLALDEALLDEFAEYGDVLRLWEAEQPAVIIGRASRWETEVDKLACHQAGIPILRRCSGGASVVIGPGCLMYSVVLATQDRPELRVVDQTHQFVLGRISQALHALDLPAQLSGTSDLTLHDRKFSGNALRCRRDAVLYHGTLLYNVDIQQVATCLRMPPRQPDYRHQRPHEQFLVNLPATADQLRSALAEAWGCQTTLIDWPRDGTERLAAERYRQPEWNQAR